ncbi:MAG: hypothetical protein Q9183_000938 [Haloplaca sp. 2 TL-2023]
MATWRSRGYVADSDEEEESQGSKGESPKINRFSRPPLQSLGNFDEDHDPHDGPATEVGSGAGHSHSQNHAIVLIEHSKKTGLPRNVEEGPTAAIWDIPSDSQSTDELQQERNEPLSHNHSQKDAADQAESQLLRSCFSKPDQSTSSSPLSLPPGSPAVPSVHGDRISSGTLDTGLLAEEVGLQHNDATTEAQLVSFDIQHDEQPTVSTRSLRHRNPIQLHPYAIESERYRQNLKKRGLKPLRIARGDSQPAGWRPDDSQADDYHVNNDSQDVDSRRMSASSLSMDSANESSLPRLPHDLERANLDFDDLPDVEALLRHMPTHTVSTGRKRRKLMHSREKQYRRNIHTPTPTASPRGQMEIAIADDDMITIPPSPPLSRTPQSSSSSRSRSKGFRFPRGVSPVNLPTPVTSSEPRRISHEPNQVTQSNEHIVISEGSETEDDDTASISTQVDHRQLKGVQRRIRGVLPASWLKLDLQKQTTNAGHRVRQHGTPSPEKRSGTQRGVARPTLRHTTSKRTWENPVELSDSLSDADTEAPHAISPVPDHRPPNTPYSPLQTPPEFDDLPLFDDIQDGVIEEDRVDDMRPTIPRNRKALASGKITRKKQTRLTDLHVRKSPVQVRRTSSGPGPQSKHYSRGDAQREKHRKPRFKPPNLGLLDLPSPNRSSLEVAPSFMRVARRTVRSRRDQGRASPSQKNIRLATDLDTFDANENLRSWRKGILKPRSNLDHVKSSRSPLEPCTGNAGAAPRKPSKRTSIVSESPLDDTTSRSRIGTRPVLRRIQSSLDNVVRVEGQSGEQLASRSTKQVFRGRIGSNSHKRPTHAGQFLSAARDSGHLRPATLEALQAKFDHDHPQSAFRRRLNRTSRPIPEDAASNPLLTKFLGGEDPVQPPVPGSPSGVKPATLESQSVYRPPRPRKSKARRTDLQRVQLAEPSTWSEGNIDPEDSYAVACRGTTAKTAGLTGLGPYGTTYTVTFDLVPLPTGSYFSEDTFLGSGSFTRSFLNGNLDEPRGYYNFQHVRRSFRCGPWDDATSTQLAAVIDEIRENIEQVSPENQEASNLLLEQTSGLLNHMIVYFSANLSFYDAIDRITFLDRSKAMLSNIFDVITKKDFDYSDANESPESQKVVCRCLQVTGLCTVLANQLRQISRHAIVPPATQTQIDSFLQDTAARTLNVAPTKQLANLTECIEDLRQSHGNPFTFDKRHAAVEVLVMSHHILLEADSTGIFWRALENLLIPPSLKVISDARTIDRCWKSLFSVLSFLEIDKQGVMEVGRRHKISMENWKTVNRLLEPVFEAYHSKVQRLPSTLNDYFRANVGRCLELINVWGWGKCESIIGVLFDFFARRNLFHLPNEESHGSPTFLERLSHRLQLNFYPEDRCFHLVLKIIGSGLQHMRRMYPGKKIRDIVWRLMPNHGRFLPKDKAIRQADLDALRNHHDLLSTLYWASPQDFRFRPNVIQRLVDVENSHKEACRINIRAWSNLITFQLTTGEASSVEPFVRWYEELLGQVLQQHHNARTEAEEQVKLAESTEGFVINRSLLESTVAQNQREIESILRDAFSAMGKAVEVAPDLEAVRALVFPNLLSALDLFSIQRSQTDKVIIDVLEVFLAFASRALPVVQTRNVHVDDDSQDYGDWSAFDTDSFSASAVSALRQDLDQHFHGGMRQLLSNCFGADKSPDDTLLAKIIDCWAALGRMSVIECSRTWSDYLGDYGHDAWTSLRETEQTRRYLGYYIAVLIESDKRTFLENQHSILKAWVGQLVERECLLKFQHRLTSSLLNADSHHPILANPPFWTTQGSFQVTASELSERRLSLISNVLSNMRKSLDDAWSQNASEVASMKADYKEILRFMMSSMKTNYQQLGTGPDVQGAYVDFVQQVVELLQQHATSICPIDRFFTDSSSFPLPAADPTYVVGQLKSYGLRLQDHRTPKQLAVFIQSVSERAAIDGQQSYLIDQLHTAMASNTELPSSGVISLRSFLLSVIFPAYIEVALGTAAGWIMAIPILQSAKLMLASMLTHANGADGVNVISISTTIMDFLGWVRRSMDLVIDRPGLVDSPQGAKILTVYFAIITAVLPSLDYLCRVSNKIRDASLLIRSFESFALFTAGLALDHTDVEIPEVHGMKEKTDLPRYGDVRAFTLQELRATLVKNWAQHEEQYYITRAQTRREVVVDVDLLEEEKAKLIGEVEGFFNCLERMTVLKSA